MPISEANSRLINEYLDVAVNDSENTDRFMELLSDDCVWSLMPPGISISGAENLRKFVHFAMGSRKHNAKSRVEIRNWFTDGEKFCVEYFHGAVVTGIKVVETVCLVCDMRDGKFTKVNEYVDTSGSKLVAFGLKIFPRVAKRKGIRYSKTL